jgi:Fe-S oxidoreductase
MCAACVEQCPVAYKDYIVEIFRALRQEFVERSLVPPQVRDFLENVYKHGNPWKEPMKKRGEWAKGTGIGQYEPGDEFLYYIGCLGSYDTRANDVARSLGHLLLRCGLRFGILGSEEHCDGNEVNMLGEQGLFELLARENIQTFEKLRVKTIVTLSPHAYNVMKNEYPRYGGTFEIKHSVQLLRDLVRKGRIDVSKGLEARVTYHDSCFLGRYNGEYDAPREILKSIPGIELVEMERNRENSFCCGGGGGNFYTGFLNGSENSPGRIRIREAHATGASILAVACPVCLVVFEDALKVEGLEDELQIMDISEIVERLTQASDRQTHWRSR